MIFFSFKAKPPLPVLIKTTVWDKTLSSLFIKKQNTKENYH